MIEYRNLRVALLGCGSVGTQVARLMREHGDELAQRVGGIEYFLTMAHRARAKGASRAA